MWTTIIQSLDINWWKLLDGRTEGVNPLLLRPAFTKATQVISTQVILLYKRRIISSLNDKLCFDNLKSNQRSYLPNIIFLIQDFEADFLWKVSLKIRNSGLILKTFTHDRITHLCWLSWLHIIIVSLNDHSYWWDIKHKTIAL